MVLQQSNILLKALLMGFLIFMGYRLAFSMTAKEVSQSFSIAYQIWGCIMVLLGTAGLLALIKNNYFLRKTNNR